MSTGPRIAFVDFWDGFDPTTWFNPLLERVVGADRITIVPHTEQPDVLVFSVFGQVNRNRFPLGTRKVFYTGERYGRSSAQCDFAISFTLDDETPNHMRCPIWQTRPKELAQAILQDHLRAWGIPSTLPAFAERERFCTWVASWVSEPREKLVQRISKEFAQVSCGGERLNNVGGPVEDKQQFLQTGRFSLALENASSPGYCTEKLLQAFNSGAIPLYWGDPEVTRDFNPEAFINIHDFETYSDLWRRLRDLENDPQKADEMLKAPIFTDECRLRLNQGRKRWEERIVRGILGRHFSRVQQVA